MPAYANIASVKAALGNQAPSGDAKLAEDNIELSLAFDRKTGRTFGVDPVVVARSVRGRGGDVLPLPKPIRATPTAVTVGGVALSAPALASLRLWLRNADGEAWAIVRTDGVSWPSDAPGAETVSVTASWADLVPTVPDEVTGALNVLVRYTAIADKAGPTGVLGPEDREQRLPDIWKDERVKQTIDRWSLAGWCAP